MRRGHYLSRDLLWPLPLVALIVNALVLGMMTVQVRAAKGRTRVVAGSSAGASTIMSRAAAEQITPPVITIKSDSQIDLDGTKMETPLDLQFRLSALSSHGTAIRVRTMRGAEAASLADALAACSRSGFTDVIIEQEETSAGQ